MNKDLLKLIKQFDALNATRLADKATLEKEKKAQQMCATQLKNEEKKLTEKMERREEQILRGEIYYVRPASVSVGSEQVAGRPAIVVSNDKANLYSPVVEMVYLTTKPKNSLAKTS